MNGAGVGGVTETATLNPIGLDSVVLELGSKSNHFSSVRLESLESKSSRFMEMEPIFLDDFVRGKPEGEDTSSKSRCPVG